jgi:hypothetical protein
VPATGFLAVEYVTTCSDHECQDLLRWRSTATPCVGYIHTYKWKRGYTYD